MVFYDARNHNKQCCYSNSVASVSGVYVRLHMYLSSIGLAEGHVGNDQMRLDTVLAWQLAADDKNVLLVSHVTLRQP
jgi:hypothetical protein